MATKRIIDLEDARQRRIAVPTLRLLSRTCEESDHRIANHLSLISSLVSLKAYDVSRQATEPDRAQVQLLLRGICAQLDAVARLHRLLATSGQSTDAELSSQLHEVCDLITSVVGGRVKVVEELDANCLVPLDQFLPITHIVAEIVTNAVKHGCRVDAPGTIFIRCRKDAAGTIQVVVGDNGPGFPESFDPSRAGGLGFRMVRGLAKTLGATIAFDSSPVGTWFRLTLPPVRPSDDAHPASVDFEEIERTMM